MFHENIMYVLTSDWFRDGGITVLSAALGLFAKIQSRNDKHGRMSRNDFAIGIELAVSAAILAFMKAIDYYMELDRWTTTSEGIAALPGDFARATLWLSFLLASIWGLSAHVRANGWKNKNKLATWSGVVVPNIVGLILLFITIYNV